MTPTAVETARTAVGNVGTAQRVVFGVENGETVLGGNVEAVEVVDCLVYGCWVVPGMHQFYVATGDIGVARQDRAMKYPVGTR